MGWDFDEEISRSFIQMMKQWDRRLAVVDEQTPLPQYAAALDAANRAAAETAAAAAAAAAAGDTPAAAGPSSPPAAP